MRKIRKGLAITVILLFIGILFNPSLNADTNLESISNTAFNDCNCYENIFNNGLAQPPIFRTARCICIFIGLLFFCQGYHILKTTPLNGLAQIFFHYWGISIDLFLEHCTWWVP